MLYKIVLHILLAGSMALSLRYPGHLKKISWVLFFMIFLDFVRLSSVKKFRRRISFDPYPPDIIEYRNLRPPYPPKKIRRLLWTAPYEKATKI